MPVNPYDCCDTIIGGRIEVRIDNGSGSKVFYGMGDARVQPQTFERTALMSNYGKLVVTVAPRPARLIMDYANLCIPDAIWEMIKPGVKQCNIEVVVWEKDRGRTHQFSNAVIVGFPEFNLSTGVISGLEVATDNYLPYDNTSSGTAVH